MKKLKKPIVIIIISIVFLAAVIMLHYLWQVNDYQSKVKNMSFTYINISSIPDGKYVGESDVGFISAKVEVLIQDGKIISIDLIQHKNDKGKAAERIINEMIDKQTTDVDVISGATNSSKVIRKAVENALLGN